MLYLNQPSRAKSRDAQPDTAEESSPPATASKSELIIDYGYSSKLE